MLAFEWASTEEFIRFHQEVLARYPAEQQAEVWRAIAEAARQFTTPDGSCRTENELLLAVGRREEDLILGGKQ